jgi:hypothetical protein
MVKIESYLLDDPALGGYKAIITRQMGVVA